MRYYEDIGLLAPAGRTDAGYRLYDETSLERLRFIARAKQLGCSLDEIADLASVWDGGRCATVQERLRATVETKIAEAHEQIAALTALAADLQRGREPVRCAGGRAVRLARPRAQQTPRQRYSTSVPLIAKPAPTAAATAEEMPIACTLGAGEMSTRLEEWNVLLADGQDR